MIATDKISTSMAYKSCLACLQAAVVFSKLKNEQAKLNENKGSLAQPLVLPFNGPGSVHSVCAAATAMGHEIAKLDTGHAVQMIPVLFGAVSQVLHLAVDAQNCSINYPHMITAILGAMSAYIRVLSSVFGDRFCTSTNVFKFMEIFHIRETPSVGATCNTQEPISQIERDLYNIINQAQTHQTACQLLLLIMAALEGTKSRLLHAQGNVKKDSMDSSKTVESKQSSKVAGAAEFEASCVICLQTYAEILELLRWTDCIAIRIDSEPSIYSQSKDGSSRSHNTASSCDALRLQRPLVGSLLAQLVHLSLAYSAHNGKYRKVLIHNLHNIWMHQLSSQTFADRYVFSHHFFTITCIKSYLDHEISKKSIQLFLVTLQSTSSNVKDWRTYFPGAFSALYKICISQRSYANTTVPIAAACCICELICIVFNDTISDNLYFRESMCPVSTSLPDDGFETNKLESLVLDARKIAQLALDKMTLKTASGSGASNQSPRVTTNNIDRNYTVPEGFTSLDAFIQWRVGVVQRLCDHLPTALTVVLSSCEKQARRLLPLVRLIGRVVNDCRFVLGTNCIVSVLPIILQSLQHESALIRKEARTQWHTFSSREVALTSWPDVSESMVSGLHAGLRGASDSAGTGKEQTFLGHLRRILTFGIALFVRDGAVSVEPVPEVFVANIKDDEYNALRQKQQGPTGTDLRRALMTFSGGTKAAIRRVCSLHDPPAGQSVRACLLHNQIYGNYSHLDIKSTRNKQDTQNDTGIYSEILTSISASYYRAPLASTHEEQTKRTISKLCVLLGRAGMASTILDIMQHTQSKLIACDADLNGLLVNMYENRGSEAGVADEPSTTRIVRLRSEQVQLLRTAVGECTTLTVALLGVMNDPVAKKNTLDETVKQSDLYGRQKDTSPPSKSQAQNAAPVQLPCALCGIIAPANRCTACRVASYCSRAHQQEHWHSHKATCKTFRQKNENSRTQIADSGITTTPSHNQEIQQAKDGVSDDEKWNATEGEDEGGWSSNHILSHPHASWTSENFPNETSHATSLTLRKELMRKAVQQSLAIIAYQLPRLSNSVHSNTANASAESITVVSCLRALHVSLAAEVLATCALIMGPSFEPYLIHALYPLVEMRTFSDGIVSTAAESTLSRIALYTLGRDIRGFLATNLDYLVNSVCARLRSGVDKLPDIAAHRVVDFVFTLLAKVSDKSAISSTPSTAAPFVHTMTPTMTALLRDLLFVSFESMDALANVGMLSHQQAQPLLAMMRVLVCHAHMPYNTPKSSTNPLQLSILHDNNNAHSAIPMAQSVQSMYVQAAVASIDNFKLNVGALFGKTTGNNKQNASDENPQVLLTPQETSDSRTNFTNKAVESKDQDNDDRDDEEVPVPEALQLIQQVLARCSYYLSLPAMSEKGVVLSMINDAIVRLSDQRRALLPAVHEVWPALKALLEELRTQAVLVANIGSIVSDGKTASKVLVSLEASPASSPMLATIARRTKPVSTEASHSFANSNSSAIPATSPRRLLLLPPLLELFQQIIELTTDFFSLKFEEDLWPELMTLLRCAACLQSQDADSDAVGTTSTASTALSKYSLGAKVKLSILSCLHKLAKLAMHHQEAHEFTYIVRSAGVCAWHVLPLLCSKHGNDVNLAALRLLQDIRIIDPAAVNTMLGVIVYSSTSTSVSQTAKVTDLTSLWIAIASDPRVLKSYAVAGVALPERISVAPGSVSTLEALSTDPRVLEQIVQLLKQPVHAVALPFWRAQLSRWQEVS